MAYTCNVRRLKEFEKIVQKVTVLCIFDQDHQMFEYRRPFQLDKPTTYGLRHQNGATLLLIFGKRKKRKLMFGTEKNEGKKLKTFQKLRE